MTESTRYRCQVVTDPAALAEVAAERVVTLAAAACADHDRFYIALAGGSTPRALYARLAEADIAARIDWSRWQVFFGDERCVPPDDAQSNYHMAREALLAHVPIAPAKVHRIEAELDDPAAAAARYARELEHLPRDVDGWPRFDLVLLGMGDDGHTASLFPDTAILGEHTLPVAAVYVEKLAAWRISLTLPVLDAAANVLLLVAGSAKRAVLHEVMQAPAPLAQYPVSWLTPRPGLEWLVDTAAAADLDPGLG